MTLHIDNPELARLAREISEITGEPIEDVLAAALREHLAKAKERARVLHAVREIGERVARLPVLDPRSPDEILGYDENGLPS